MASTDSDRGNDADLHGIVGPVQAHDDETVAFWRRASPAAHATAMIELSRYAERMAAQTGLGKDPAEVFPGFPPPSQPRASS